MVSCCTNIASPANTPTVTPVIATKDKQESDACVNDSHYSQDDICNDLSGCGEDNRDDKGDDSLDSFLDFWIQRVDLPLRPTVFTVLIYPVLSNQMLRAATAVLNKFVPKELLLILNISKISLSPLGCMYFESPSSCLPLDSMCLSCVQRASHNQKSVSSS
jgi:hypothetical protein